MQTNKPLSAEDKKEIDEVLKDKTPAVAGNPDFIPGEEEDKALSTVSVDTTSRSVALNTSGINIEGLQDVPSSVIPVPFVRLVQGQSRNITLTDGKSEAPEGSFYFNDIQQAYERLSFVMLRAKHQITIFDREENGKIVKKPTKQILILGITTDSKKLFILALSVMSFSNFGRLINKLREAGVNQSWQYEIVATAEKQENEKGKFYVQRYDLGEKLSEAQIDEMAGVYGEYGGVLDREYTQEQMEGEE